MPVGGKKQAPVVVELAEATVISPASGREWDVSGSWNRMFESRVLTDYSYEGLGRIAALSGGESLEYCYGCGKCVPVCPVDLV